MDNQEYSEREKDNYHMYLIILQLLKARGFTISEDKQNISEAQFRSRRRELQEDLFFKEDDSDNQIIMAVKCNFMKKKITQQIIEDFIKVMSDKVKITHFFVVAATNTRTKGMQIDKNVQLLQKTRDQVRIQIFHDQDLKFNLLDHDLVPKHIPLSQKQKQQLLQYYKVKLSQLPKLLHNDPVAKFLGLRRNQVVKIIRKSQTAGTYTTYRVVI